MTRTSIKTTEDLGRTARVARQAQGLRLEDVAIAAGVGIRFVSELERGKPSVRLAETLRVLAAVGVRISAEDAR
jgi:HTH-type transcriptional regulator/antitoxin HipB